MTDDAQQPFIRVSFITLNSNRLFTAEQVADLIEQHSSHTTAPERQQYTPTPMLGKRTAGMIAAEGARAATLAENKRVLDEIRNTIKYEGVTGLIRKIESLRQAGEQE